MTLAHAGGIELVTDFPAHQFRRGGQRVERERGGKALLQMQRAIDAPQHHAIEPAAVQGQPEHARQPFAFAEVNFQKVVHGIAFATHVCRAFSPSAQPSRLKS